MLFIAHRGNISGANPKYENHPDYLFDAQQAGYDVEIDLWWLKGTWFLGHDMPLYKITNDFFNRMPKLNTIYHCKNSDAFEQMHNAKRPFHYFWHEEDQYTLTSRGIPWVYPGERLFPYSICVMPERGYKGDLNQCYAICTDNIKKYKQFIK